MERRLQEFELQTNAVQDIQNQLKQLQQQINVQESKENEQLRNQLTTLSYGSLYFNADFLSAAKLFWQNFYAEFF